MGAWNGLSVSPAPAGFAQSDRVPHFAGLPVEFGGAQRWMPGFQFIEPRAVQTGQFLQHAFLLGDREQQDSRVIRLMYHPASRRGSRRSRRTIAPPERILRHPAPGDLVAQGLSKSGMCLANAALSWLLVVLAESWRNLVFCIAINRISPGAGGG